MIKSFRKRTIPVDLFEFPGYLEGALFAYGKMGSGKSVSMMSVIQGYHDNHKYKIVDGYGGERNEGLYWTIPSDENRYWAKMGVLGKFDEPASKQYKVNLLYPYFGTKLPKKLPKKPLYVNSKVFTIPLLSLTNDDVSMVIGTISETSKYELRELLGQCNKKTNAENIDEIIMMKKMKNIKNTLFYKNFLLPLIRNRTIMDSYCDYNIDIASEMKDVETVSVICLDFVPKEFHLFILNYFFRTVNELLDLNKIPKRNMIFIRESATFFRATDDSVLDERYKIFRNQLSMYLRMGRRGIFYCCDCQSASETRGIVSDANDFLFCFKMSSGRDKEELFLEAKKEKRVRQDQLNNLAFLEKGQCLVLPSGKNSKSIQLTLPRTKTWKREDGNFYRNVWEKFGGSWSTTEEIHDYIEQRCKPTHDFNFKPIEKSDTSSKVESTSISEVVSEVYAPEKLELPNDIDMTTVNEIEKSIEKPKEVIKKKKIKTQKDIDLDDLLNSLPSIEL